MNRQLLVARAWRDPVFRSELPADTLRDLPQHPAGDPAGDEDLWNSVRISHLAAVACLPDVPELFALTPVRAQMLSSAAILRTQGAADRNRSS